MLGKCQEGQRGWDVSGEGSNQTRLEKQWGTSLWTSIMPLNISNKDHTTWSILIFKMLNEMG